MGTSLGLLTETRSCPFIQLVLLSSSRVAQTSPQSVPLSRSRTLLVHVVVQFGMTPLSSPDTGSNLDDDMSLFSAYDCRLDSTTQQRCNCGERLQPIGCIAFYHSVSSAAYMSMCTYQVVSVLHAASTVNARSTHPRIHALQCQPLLMHLSLPQATSSCPPKLSPDPHAPCGEPRPKQPAAFFCPLELSGPESGIWYLAHSTPSIQ
jgi:hypothetical protein